MYWEYLAFYVTLIIVLLLRGFLLRGVLRGYINRVIGGLPVYIFTFGVPTPSAVY